jgi:hypothetical protein
MNIEKSLDNFDPNVVAVAEEFSSAYAKVEQILETYYNRDYDTEIPKVEPTYWDKYNHDGAELMAVIAVLSGVRDFAVANPGLAKAVDAIRRNR